MAGAKAMVERREINGDKAHLPGVDYANLEAHPLADLMPMIKAEEFEKLKADIRKNGLQMKIRLFQGKVLDGRNRYKALKALAAEGDITLSGAFFDPWIGTEEQAEAFVISTNLQRRQITAKEKREVVIKMMDKHPNASRRKIAEICGVAHSFVGKIMDELAEPERKDREAFDAFCKTFDDATDKFRAEFVGKYRNDLREIMG